ncbi:MAG: hypothetical protein JSV21_04855, partial [Nitrospirota bacterium]
NTVSIYNNIIYNNSAFLGSDINLFNTNASVICIRNNNFSDMYIDNLLGLKSNVNNINTSPGYGVGYSLSAGSTMIGRGDNGVAPSIDIDGIARPQGSIVDIGAYEYFTGSVDGTVGGINSTCGAGSGSGGGCFIATAAYGSYMHKDVKVLRDFRDEILLKSRAGKAFVELYYRYSPPVADRIAKSDGLRFIVRVVLTPIVFVIKYPLMPAFVLLFGGMILFRRKNA